MNQETAFWESPFNVAPYDAHMRIIAQIAPYSRVLDIGCNTGQFGEQLISRLGCEVVGVEISPEAANVAAQRLHRVICSSIENLPKVLSSDTEHFDYIVAADVLEHTTWPPDTIRVLTAYLSPSSTMIISVPNVANYGIRLALLSGRFDYGSNSVLAGGHYHFFTLRTATALLVNAGLSIEKIDVSPGLFLSPIYHRSIERVLGRFLWYRRFEYRLSCQFKNLFAFQFIVTGVA